MVQQSAPPGIWDEDPDGASILLAEGRPQAWSRSRRKAGSAMTRRSWRARPGDVAGGSAPGQVRVVADHLNVSGGSLFLAPGMVSAGWDATLTERLGGLRGVSGSSVVALVPGPLRPSPAESRALTSLGADAAVTDSVAEAMVLASRGVAVSALTYLDAPAAGGNLGRAQLSLRQASGVTLAAVEEILRGLRAGS